MLESFPLKPFIAFDFLVEWMAKLVALVHNKIDYCASVVCYCHCWSNQWWPHINQTTSVVAQPLLLNESHRAQTTLKTSDRCATMLRFLKKCKCILSQLMDPHHSYSWTTQEDQKAEEQNIHECSSIVSKLAWPYS